ncbi:hypothetical protein [Beijerinckia sp. L45]|uniref:hypothetical protein n=1 Tax=Beijerinckia sp. L45 TaxID=1641855 RepID=UPI00131BC0A3|nr:hypothetical protein [Beijerinckia sp. L45]
MERLGTIANAEWRMNAIILFVFLCRMHGAEAVFGREFALDRRKLIEHPDLDGMTEWAMRKAMGFLVEHGLVGRMVQDKSVWCRKPEGYRKKPILFVFTTMISCVFTKLFVRLKRSPISTGIDYHLPKTEEEENIYLGEPAVMQAEPAKPFVSAMRIRSTPPSRPSAAVRGFQTAIKAAAGLFSPPSTEATLEGGLKRIQARLAAQSPVGPSTSTNQSPFTNPTGAHA